MVEWSEVCFEREKAILKEIAIGLLMRLLCLLLVIFSPLAALELTLNSGKEGGKSFSVLRLSHTEPFACVENYNRFSEIENVVCRFKGSFERGFSFEQMVFFKIDTFQDKDDAVVVITPKKKAKLFSLNQDGKRTTPLIKERAPMAASWQVIGYEDKIPFLNPQQPVGLNFPIAISSANTPYIGALDVAKKPLVIEQTPDLQMYVTAKGFMDRESYDEAINTINETLLRYPSTIFLKDLLLFKIRALFEQDIVDNAEEAINLAKSWLNAYPTDAAVSEVLYVLARLYGQQQFYEQARYYYDRLKEEYLNDEFEVLSRVSFADDLQARGDSKIAPQLYISALNDAKTVKTASLAAFKLADYYIQKGTADDTQNAQKLLEQVIQANPAFFAKDPDILLNQLIKWADKGFYVPTAQIAHIAYNAVKDGNDNELSENLLRNSAIWYESGGQFRQAADAYATYLKAFPGGDMRKEMQRRSDNLLFSYDEGNSTQRLANLDRLIETYPNSEEEQKAYEHKASLFVQEGKFDEAVALENRLGADSPIISQAAEGAVRRAIQNQDCMSASFYLQKYHNLSLNQDELIAGFDCLAMASFYDDALRIATEADPTIDNSTRRLQWLYRIATIQERKGDYPKAIAAARDGLYVSDSLANGIHSDIIIILTHSLLKENRVAEAMQYLPRLEENFKDDNRMIEIQKELLNDAAKRDDRPAIEYYAKELLRLQNLHQRPEYSPWAELTLVESYIKNNRAQDALSVLNQAEQLKLSNDDLTKILYNKAAVADSLGLYPLSLESYRQCSELTGSSPYRGLCESAYQLLEERLQQAGIDVNTTAPQSESIPSSVPNQSTQLPTQSGVLNES